MADSDALSPEAQRLLELAGGREKLSHGQGDIAAALQAHPELAPYMNEVMQHVVEAATAIAQTSSSSKFGHSLQVLVGKIRTKNP
ncbi:MAG: hypothetical protein KDD69_10320 [Bdellovibrionales bacterium]|nr:hypothetical protein [Bdellovibrionales bacterium]